MCTYALHGNKIHLGFSREGATRESNFTVRTVGTLLTSVLGSLPCYFVVQYLHLGLSLTNQTKSHTDRETDNKERNKIN